MRIDPSVANVGCSVKFGLRTCQRVGGWAGAKLPKGRPREARESWLGGVRAGPRAKGRLGGSITCRGGEGGPWAGIVWKLTWGIGGACCRGS